MSNGGRPDERRLRLLPTFLSSGNAAAPPPQDANDAAGVLLTLGRRAAADSSTRIGEEEELHPPTSEEMHARCPSRVRRAEPAATRLIDRASIMPAAVTKRKPVCLCGLALGCCAGLRCSSDHTDEFWWGVVVFRAVCRLNPRRSPTPTHTYTHSS